MLLVVSISRLMLLWRNACRKLGVTRWPYERVRVSQPAGSSRLGRLSVSDAYATSPSSQSRILLPNEPSQPSASSRAGMLSDGAELDRGFIEWYVAQEDDEEDGRKRLYKTRPRSAGDRTSKRRAGEKPETDLWAHGGGFGDVSV
ncbi:hypothetical protein GUITHDRAFT_122920 [Guillardia theta CCMP2712]|uniref:RWP-RK domain-containing protein n=1 Tax=Guillardia theta (strain CCMP2712) TaxID=905079 RepID=L1I4R9_GUITC|nr:hypothetical protein GUITHDRAFT_122920 [Guillardia theta CCMP2712]EKX30874.1 hypothetical protein GUITHDRAFT_122920 [Guillardia theta CCMP2712]|eukprot:XP_005817854.1 hypothetical protein GUITHDRAFT_122920 [Guillardia theta CCMP2712]